MPIPGLPSARGGAAVHDREGNPSLTRTRGPRLRPIRRPRAGHDITGPRPAADLPSPQCPSHTVPGIPGPGPSPTPPGPRPWERTPVRTYRPPPPSAGPRARSRAGCRRWARASPTAAGMLRVGRGQQPHGPAALSSGWNVPAETGRRRRRPDEPQLVEAVRARVAQALDVELDLAPHRGHADRGGDVDRLADRAPREPLRRRAGDSTNTAAAAPRRRGAEPRAAAPARRRRRSTRSSRSRGTSNGGAARASSTCRPRSSPPARGTSSQRAGATRARAPRRRRVPSPIRSGGAQPSKPRSRSASRIARSA